MEDDYTGGDICIDGSTDCTGNDIVYGSRTYIHLKKKASPVGGAFSVLYKERFLHKSVLYKIHFSCCKGKGFYRK